MRKVAWDWWRAFCMLSGAAMVAYQVFGSAPTSPVRIMFACAVMSLPLFFRPPMPPPKVKPAKQREWFVDRKVANLNARPARPEPLKPVDLANLGGFSAVDEEPASIMAATCKHEAEPEPVTIYDIAEQKADGQTVCWLCPLCRSKVPAPRPKPPSGPAAVTTAGVTSEEAFRPRGDKMQALRLALKRVVGEIKAFEALADEHGNVTVSLAEANEMNRLYREARLIQDEIKSMEARGGAEEGLQVPFQTSWGSAEEYSRAVAAMKANGVQGTGIAITQRGHEYVGERHDVEAHQRAYPSRTFTTPCEKCGRPEEDHDPKGDPLIVHTANIQRVEPEPIEMTRHWR